MFKLGQILTTTQLIRNFHRVTQELKIDPQPVLITQRSGHHLVLVNAEIFEELMNAKLQRDGLEANASNLKALIEAYSDAY